MSRLLDMVPEYDRYGIDISSTYLDSAMKTGVCICLAKVEDMPYQDVFFDKLSVQMSLSLP